MTTQKTFKGRVRARMAKTGESYTAARHQLLRKAADPDAPPPDASADLGAPGPGPDPAADSSPEPVVTGTASDAALVSDDAMRRGSGRGHEEWFALLDTWGATERRHPEIARWLQETHGVGGWWAQSITVAYERARGMRATHQMGSGFNISVTRTIAVDAERLLAAFTIPAIRARWLPDAELRQRPTRAASSARFDWSDPPSRVVVTAIPKDAQRATIALQHERLPDGETAERLKAAWREWLGVLKDVLERG